MSTPSGVSLNLRKRTKYLVGDKTARYDERYSKCLALKCQAMKQRVQMGLTRDHFDPAFAPHF